MSTLRTALALLRAVFAAAGITDSSKVMIYGSPVPASRLFFTLDYLGHTQVKMYDGSIEGWTLKKLPAKTGK